MAGAKHLLLRAVRRCGSQAALAKRIGVRQSLLSQWIHRASIPRRSSLTDAVQRRLYVVTGRTIDELWPSLAEAAPVPESLDNPFLDALSLSQLALEFAERNTIPSPEDVVAWAHKMEVLQQALATLTAKQRTIIDRHFGLTGLPPETLKEIGHDLGRTTEAVRQIEAKALTRLRHYFEHPGGRKLAQRRISDRS